MGFIIGLFVGAILGFFTAALLSSGKIADRIAQRENPKYAEKRINIKPRCSVK